MLIYRHKQRLKEAQSIEQEKGQSETGWQEGHEIETEQEGYEKMTVPELKEMAKNKGVEGYSNMKKDELINVLKEGD